jgi:L-malate glycosyltransferase
VVVVSETLRRDLIANGVPPARVHLIRNAWQPALPFRSRAEARAGLGLDASARVAGWVGRLSAEKAPEVMIEALAACPVRDVILSMVGAGPLDREVRQLAEARGVGDRVRWHGIVPEAGRSLTAFDVLLLTSWTEGTPMVLLEAMAAGVPVVATAVGGVPDVVSAREALLVPAGAAEAIGRALEETLMDPLAAKRRADSARERLARDFAIAPWVARYREVYSACAGG